MPRVIFHLDMDAFYASVEQRDNPQLRGKPVIVGSPPTQRGVVCAASYEARKFGVRSAMPSMTAGRLCPRGIFVRPRMSAYQAESREIMKIVATIGAEVEQISIDEAYLDVSKPLVLEKECDADECLYRAVPIARQLKATIVRERGLTASIGIAANKLLAKLASDFQKLAGSFGPTLKRYAFGEDDRPLELGDDIKSISSEETFLKDTDDRKVLRRCLREQADDISARLKRKHLGAHTVQVKVRYSDFTTLTRQISTEEPLTESADLYRMGCFLLGRDKLVCRPLRLLGLGVSGLREPSWQQLPLL
jgi:DNA polymerase-4